MIQRLQTQTNTKLNQIKHNITHTNRRGDDLKNQQIHDSLELTQSNMFELSESKCQLDRVVCLLINEMEGGCDDDDKLYATIISEHNIH